MLEQQAEPPDAGISRFVGDVRGSLDELRHALQALIAATPGETRRAADLQRSLRLDAALAWQVHTLATAQNSFEGARLVPKAGSMERLLRCARESGVPQAVIADIERAYAAFGATVNAHAGDRDVFDAMLAGLHPADGASVQRLRRAAFKANAAVWGLMCRCSVHAVIFYQRPTGEHDCLSIRGRIGLKRLRASALVSLYASSRTWGGPACPPEGTAMVSTDSCEILADYTSSGPMRVRSVAAPDGTRRDFLELEGVGAESEATVWWRTLAQDFPGGTTRPPHGTTAPCLEPAEVMYVDLLTPKGWAGPAAARAWMTPESARFATVGPDHAAHTLPFEGAAVHLGSSPRALYTTHAPEYAGLVEAQLAELAWPREGFDIFRCEVKFPALFSAVHLGVGGPG